MVTWSPFIQSFHKLNFLFYKRRLYLQFCYDNSLYSIKHNFKEVKTMLKKNFKLLQG